MLNNEDIQKLIEVFTTKEDLKEAVSNLVTKDDFNNLMSALDAYAKRVNAYFQ